MKDRSGQQLINADQIHVLLTYLGQIGFIAKLYEGTRARDGDWGSRPIHVRTGGQRHEGRHDLTYEKSKYNTGSLHDV